MQNFMGMDGFIWFTGVVEDRDDPSKLGRVRVRCVGHHTDDKEKMRDFHLLSKERFLESYSYLTEEEYNLTLKKVNDLASS